MKTLVLFEKAEDEGLLKKFLSQKENNNFIALSPEAAYELEKKRIKYKSPEDYLTYNDLKELHIITENKLNELMRHLDNKVQDYDKRFKENNLTPFFRSAYKFKIFHDNLCIKISELNKILKEEAPDRVIYCSHTKVPNDDTLLVDNYESVYGQILAQPAFRKRYNNIDWTEFKGHKINDVSFHLYKQKILERLKTLIREISFPRLECIFNKKMSKVQSTIYISESKNFKYIINPLIKLGIKPIKVNRGKIRSIKYNNFKELRHWQEFMNFIENDPEIHRLCSFPEYYFFGLIRERFIFFINSLEGYYRLYKYFINLLNKEQIRLIIQETYSPHIIGNASLTEAADKLDIPKLCWIHGGTCSFFDPGWAYIDLRFVDYYLVYGNKMKERFRKQCAGREIDIRVTGCPYIEDLNKGPQDRKTNKKQIVYAVIDYFYNQHYLGWNEPDFRDNRKWCINRRILDVLGKFQDRYNIILKLLPVNTKNSLFRKYINDKGFNRIEVIEGERKIYHLVFNTDLFIFDCISTGFFEASVGKGDIFAYSRMGLPKDSIEIIKTRAQLYNSNLEEFLTALYLYLDEEKFEWKDRNSVFVEEYLNIKKGQNNIAIAVDVITSVLNN